jgi:hypothetical protein
MPPTDPGLPLAHFRNAHRFAGVRLTCDGCHLHTDLDLEKVIAKLAARGVEGETLGIRTLAVLVNAPCKRCGGRAFSTAPAWS